MNIIESIRNKRKLAEQLTWYTFKMTFMSTVNYRKLQNQIQVETLHFDQMIKNMNHII